VSNIYLCYIDTIDFVIPDEINSQCKERIDVIKQNKVFRQLISTGTKSNNKFYIASQSNFYQIFNLLIKAGISYKNIIKPPPVAKVVNISGADYHMNVEFLTNPSKPINRSLAKQNLLQFKKILDKASLKFFLAYGTLLGAVREGDFIAHDSDVDVGMYATDKEKFLPLLFTLKDAGLELVRFDEKLISLMKDGEYIDIYFFEKKLFPKLGWHCNGLYMPTKYLESLSQLTFHGHNFAIPTFHLGLLVFLYGKNWRTPVKDSHAQPLTSIKSILVKFLPLHLKLYLKRLLKG